MSTVNTSFQVSFGEGISGTGSHLSAEVDSRDDGGNGGKTSFVPGDTVHFLVYTSSNVTYDAPEPSAGTVAGGSTISIEKEEDLVFTGSKEASLQVPAASIDSVTWLGNSLGELTLTDEKTVTADAEGVAIARVTYTANAYGHTLASPASVAGLTDYSIVVYILGHVTR